MSSLADGKCKGYLSNRTSVAIQPLSPYLPVVLEALQDPWSADNQNGNLVYSVAENKQSVGLLKEKLVSVANEVPDDCFGYTFTVGLKEFRIQLANYLQKTFMKGVEGIDESQIVVGNGCGPVLDNLFFSLANSGDAVLVPAPYYPVFDNDIKVKANLVPFPAHLDFQSGDLYSQLDNQLKLANEQGTNISILLLTHPNNPLGTVYTEDQLAELVRWCCDKKIHLISDEIYANSVFDPSAEFKSIAWIMQKHQAEFENCVDLVHVVFGFSKDWCASGLRVGCLWTQNQQLLAVMGNINYFALVPNMVQYQLAKVLEDEEFVDKFLNTNRSALFKLNAFQQSCRFRL
eukprot:TRINITY_DN2031_c0_g1_i4.p1 TRINITY_DN2031_c0_g1~~TRINITY_DN2031_c0_g1_i4.p1  ORF type:complete len:375 (-),score=26.49 TRINITY_DN2031_c0_g1_i4:446-1483(-)